MPATRTHSKVLVLSANALVRDNVRVLLGSMGFKCLLASTLEEALFLFEHEKPYALILDPYEAGSTPGQVVASLHRMVPHLRERAIVLTNEKSDSELVNVLDVYSLPQVPLYRLHQGLWPRLDSLVHWNIVPQKVPRPARLVYDSLLQPLAGGIRSSLLADRRFIYQSDRLMVDLSLESHADSQRIRLLGQVADSAHPDHQLDGVPVVLQGQSGLIGVTATNEFGEFHFEFHSEAGITLDVGVKGNQPLSIELADLNCEIQETTGDSRLPETFGGGKSSERLSSKKKK